MGTVGWLLVVAVGIALGFSAGRLWPGSAGKLRDLERDRDAARADLETYRQEVSAHFEATAELFDKVTADYRGLYEHLAVGARQLGAIRGEPVDLPLAEPEKRRLAPAEPAPLQVPEEAPAEERSGQAPPFETEVARVREADTKAEAEAEAEAGPEGKAEADTKVDAEIEKDRAANEATFAPELEEKDRNVAEQRP